MGAKSIVAIVRGSLSPGDEEVDRMVREAVALAGGLEGIVSEGGTVVIKPNLVAPVGPERGATTDPRVCRSLADQAREWGGRAIIAESSALGVDTEEGGLDVLRDTRIVAGMMDEPPPPSPKRTIFVGACASKFRYQSEFVKGCPPNNVDIRACITGVTPDKFFVEQ